MSTACVGHCGSSSDVAAVSPLEQEFLPPGASDAGPRRRLAPTAVGVTGPPVRYYFGNSM